MQPHVPHEQVPYTYREYALLPEDGRRHELIDGEFYVTPAPSPFHQTVSRRLQHQLMLQLEETGIALVFDAPVDVILAETTVVQPDLAILRTARKHLITQRGLEGPPDLVVEILSPSNSGTDLFLKKALYAKHQIPEYWIVDPSLGHILVHRTRSQPYDLLARFDRASTLTSVEFPEIHLPLAPVFAPH